MEEFTIGGIQFMSKGIFGMPDEHYAKQIREECPGYDKEMDHYYADQILLEILEKLGFTETVKAFNELDKWYA